VVDKNKISTITHIRFDPSEPKWDNIGIEDIAHSLSMLTRANGHFDTFFSVARHSLNCAYEAKQRGFDCRVQLLCLLHDAAEAYIGDMTRPLKMKIPEFSEIEKKYQDIIFSKFISPEITEEERSKARLIDDAMLYHEFLTFNGEELFDRAPDIKIDVTKGISGFRETEKEFLDLFRTLEDEIQQTE